MSAREFELFHFFAFGWDNGASGEYDVLRVFHLASSAAKRENGPAKRIVAHAEGLGNVETASQVPFPV